MQTPPGGFGERHLVPAPGCNTGDLWRNGQVSVLIPTQRPVPPGSIDGKSQERKRCKVGGGGGWSLGKCVEHELQGRSPSLVIWLLRALSKHSLSHLTLLTS